MALEPNAATPYVRSHPRLDGVQVVDPIEDVQFALLTPEAVERRPCDTDRFRFPVDAATTLLTDTVTTPYLVDAFVHDADGELVVEGLGGEAETLPAGEYTIDVSSVGMKLYLAVEGPARLTPGENELRLAVDGDAVHVGMRSVHERPAATVTTTDEPRDVMAALSSLGSALKTTSPERSFPTLRGHPPLIERGAELSIPDAVETPDTGIRIEVPPDLRYVYPVTSLAYYLGATVAPAPTPMLVADGESFPLDGGDGFESGVARTLKRLFLLDCVTRTEGFYRVDLHERSLVEGELALDFDALYDRPVAERTRRYMTVPYEAVANAVPKWKLTADVVPRAAHVRTLPFLANELAVVRSQDVAEMRRRSVDDLADDVEEFFRDNPTALARRSDVSRSGTEMTAETADETVFRPAAADSVEQAYVGEGIPYGASKMTAEAYRRRLDYEPSSDPRIGVTVVCNDERMSDENVVSSIYGTRDWIDFDISFHHDLSTAELREVLRADTDFLHYIGHVDDEGIRCADGYLDAETVDDVGVSAFFLNACNSYDQGRALVEGGALAGMTTLTDVLDKGASEVGRTVARLLNHGFSLASTIPIVTEYEYIGHHYVVIGDGSISLVTNESGTPTHAEIEKVGDEEYEISLYGYPTLFASLGSIYKPFLDGMEVSFLNTGGMGPFRVSSDELDTFLNRQEIPVVFDNSLHWSTTFELP